MFEPISLERIARVEEAMKHEREMRQRDISWLTSRLDTSAACINSRLMKLESVTPDQGAADRKALIKVALAVALPLLVYLLTGSPKLALQAMGAAPL